MFKSDYEREIFNLINGRNVDSNFLVDWYQDTLKMLEILSHRNKSIRHPRHLGDARESDFVSLINSFLPEKFKTVKGFAIDSFTTRSREQDCMIVNTTTGVKFVTAGDISYVPIESVMASIEIKSKLTKDELKKAILNCVSLKRLQFPLDDDEGAYTPERARFQILYNIFSYSSDFSLAELTTSLTDLSKDIKAPLCINMVYVLNKGLIVPRLNDSPLININHNVETTGKYNCVESMNIRKADPKTMAIPFLWYLSCILHHIVSEGKSRSVPDFLAYVFEPIIFARHIEAEIENKNERKNTAPNSG